MIIDSHVHIGNWDYKWFSHLNRYPIMEIFKDGIIDKAVFIPSDQKQNHILLKELYRVCRQDRFFFVPWFDPKDFRSEGTFKFIGENINQIYGLKVHAGIDKIECSIANSKYKPLLSLAKSFGLPLLVHCGRWEEMSGWKHLLKTAELYPDLKFIGAHLGGDREDLKILALCNTIQ